MGEGDLQTTVKDRVMIHLLEQARRYTDFEAPVTLTQAGIAQGSGVSRGHAATVLAELLHDELVQEKKSRVVQAQRKLKTYNLSQLGLEQATYLRDSMLKRDYLEGITLRVFLEGKDIRLSEFLLELSVGSSDDDLSSDPEDDPPVGLEPQPLIAPDGQVSEELWKMVIREPEVTPRYRASIMVCSSILLAFIILIFQGRSGHPTSAEFSSLLLLTCSFLGFAFLGAVVPRETRSDISAFAGTILVLYGFSCLLAPALLNGSSLMAPYWLILGSLLASLSLVYFQTERVEFYLSVGAGAAAIGLMGSMSVIFGLPGWDLSPVLVVGLLLLVALSNALMVLKLLPQIRLDTVWPSLALVPYSGLGGIFLAVGGVLVLNGRLMEGMVELFFALPVLAHVGGRLRSLATTDKAMNAMVLLHVLMIASVVTLVLGCMGY